MDYFFKGLTTEQRCAVMGFAIDFCGCKVPTPKQFDELETLLANIHTELGVKHSDVKSFITKMETNGRLQYAIEVLKTIEDNRLFSLFYPYFYSVVATLGSHDGLEKLNKIYNDEFGYDKAEIELVCELSNIRKF